MRKYATRLPKLTKKGQSRPEFRVLCAKEYNGLKKYTTASACVADKYQLCSTRLWPSDDDDDGNVDAVVDEYTG